jgi:hypothetical protein
MTCHQCGGLMRMVERWDEGGCCGVSVVIVPTCPRCSYTRGPIDTGPFPWEGLGADLFPTGKVRRESRGL